MVAAERQGAGQAPPQHIAERIEVEGIAIEFSMEPVNAPGGWSRPPRQGDDVVFRFTIADTLSSSPLPGANPAAWMGLRIPGELTDAAGCTNKIASYLGGSIFAAAELDLNVYYVLALNEDATITVVDPLFGFGDTKLLAMVALQSPGEDWVLNADESELFVSMPDVDAVAVVDTNNWEVLVDIEVGTRPGRVGLQPDGHYLWVAHAGDGGDPTSAGVTVIDTTSHAVVARIPTGAAPFEMAFSDDNRFVFVSNRDAATVSIIDIRSLTKAADVGIGGRPGSIAFSPLSQMAYVAEEISGSVVVIDAERRALVTRMQADPGLGQIKFPAGRRFGLVVNPRTNQAHVIDVASDQIIQTVALLQEPDQIVFSDELAYIRHAADETVLIIPLNELGRPGERVGTVDFPGGQSPFGAGSMPSPADSIVQAPGANAVLIANPADRTIYFYMEGMAAPMGNFFNYSREPRAVLVVDRSLTETRPGVYETVAKLRDPGVYDVAFFLDAPRVVHCFEISVEPDPAAVAAAVPEVLIEPLFSQRELRVGEPIDLQFRLRAGGDGAPLLGLSDVRVLTFLAPGIWQQRQWAEEEGGGVYRVGFVPPRPGVYYVYLEVASLGLGLNNAQYTILRAVDGAMGER